jgi:hypothetical protein
MMLENLAAPGIDVVTSISAFILLGILGFLGVLIYLHFKFRDRLYAKIIMPGRVHTEDITGKVMGFTWSSCRYEIDNSKVVRIHPVIPKNAIYYLQNCSKPIWFTGTRSAPSESELRLSAYELNNVLRANLSELLKAGLGLKLRMPGFKWVLLLVGLVIAAIIVAVVLSGGSPAIPPTGI